MEMVQQLDIKYEWLMDSIPRSIHLIFLEIDRLCQVEALLIDSNILQ